MARNWTPRQPPAKTSLTEIARRYHACAVALAHTWGLTVPEVLAQHRESVTAIFIESGRCDLRLPAGVKLPPLVSTAAEVGTPERLTAVERSNGSPNGARVSGELTTVSPSNGQPEPTPEAPAEAAPPTTIPAGLPCAGQRISDLKPPHLRMLLSKVDQLAAHEGSGWRPLLEALAAERQARLAQGQRPKRTPVAGEGHGT